MPRIINKDVLITKGSFTADQVDSAEKALNELNQFRTYSYHHILVAANTTAAANYIINSTDMDEWMQGENYEDKYKPKNPPGSSPGKDAYMVLINGLTDAEFVIQSLEVETLIDPTARTSTPHASFTEGTIEILEPKGVRFMNLLKDVCDGLDSDPNGLTFVIKTVFVGYTDAVDGQPQIARIIEVPPIQFFMMDLTGEFTAAGSSYQIQIVGHINGTPRLPIYGRIEQSNVSGGTVRDALTNLETTLNDAAQQAYETLKKQLDESNSSSKADSANPESFSPSGRRVKYVILVSDIFASLPLDNVHPRNQGDGGTASLATPQGVDIETAITDVLLSSTGLYDIMNKKITTGYKTIFKIDSSLETTTEEAIVTYSVKPCDVPITVKDNRDHKGTPIEPEITSRYIIEFDYIFTGSNIDVLEYDMKMALGIAFFQSFGSSNNLPGSFGGASGDVTTVGSGTGTVLNKDKTIMRKYSIIPPSGTIADPAARNKRESAKTADFRTFMARQAAFESLNSKLKIAGIPWLLGAFNMTAADVANPAAQTLKEKIPLIKVNVRMPVRDSDFIAGQGNTAYTEEFWYTGYFQIMSVKSIFRDGSFEQELDLVSMLFEEMVAPTAAGAPPPRRTDTTTTKKTDKSSAPAPVETAEQKAKLGVKSTPLTPDQILNCQSVRNQPITMASARRTHMSKSFTLEQLIRREINIPHLSERILNNLCALANKLEEVQTLLGHSITITSGFRCPAYNAGTKGSSKTSDHMQGVAADFVCPAFGSPHKIFDVLQKSGLDFRQVICETSSSASWVHVSFNIDPTLKPIAASVKYIPNMRV